MTSEERRHGASFFPFPLLAAPPFVLVRMRLMYRAHFNDNVALINSWGTESFCSLTVII